MSISAINDLSLDEDEIKGLYAEILKIPALRGLNWDTTSAEVIEDVWRKVITGINNPDPLYSEKLNLNEKISAQYALLQRMVAEAADPLYMAVKLAILGNSLDLMMADNPFAIQTSITDRVKAPLSNENYSKFKQQLQASKRVLYFGDNAGEIVFDKLLIETIKKTHPLEIDFVVRSIPTMNDATLKEARSVGIDKIVRVIENGIDGPLPGTVLRRCSQEVNDLVLRSDLIVSKGGGNFDTLDEERMKIKKKISFLLLSKCEPYYRHFGVEIYNPILANFF
jgi:uncharacterized protein with ATP-grasp and redox domains